MSRRPDPPQPPADLPDHVSHGSSFAHRWFKCRCVECKAWRSAYDKNRSRGIRDGTWKVRRQGRGWYVCVASWGVTFAEHEYNRAGACIRCGADRETEEFWEAKWKESDRECRTRDRPGDDPEAQGRGRADARPAGVAGAHRSGDDPEQHRDEPERPQGP